MVDFAPQNLHFLFSILFYLLSFEYACILKNEQCGLQFLSTFVSKCLLLQNLRFAKQIAP